ncbi:MAG: helix-turn-helix domain-containing protein [Clostridiales bacterium]|nr:helix-turn-helix domain-containing protein [Clostridiales bacterium]
MEVLQMIRLVCPKRYISTEYRDIITVIIQREWSYVREKYENSENSAAVDGTRITELRNRLHLSKTQFAIGIGYTATQITRAETGESVVSDELCERISSTYGVRKEWLFGGEGEPWIDGSEWSGKLEPQKGTAGQRLREVYKESGLSQ